jgi:hypothetical protein
MVYSPGSDGSSALSVTLVQRFGETPIDQKYAQGTTTYLCRLSLLVNGSEGNRNHCFPTMRSERQIGYLCSVVALVTVRVMRAC